jgi:hypothetical protein
MSERRSLTDDQEALGELLNCADFVDLVGDDDGVDVRF